MGEHDRIKVNTSLAQDLRSLFKGLRLLGEEWKPMVGGLLSGGLIAALCWWVFDLPDGGKAWKPRVFVLLGSCLGLLFSLVLIMIDTSVALVLEGEAAAAESPRRYGILKRALDLVCAGFIGLLLLLPMAAITVLVRLSSPGPALYWSDRIGKGNRVFRMPKFRSMRTDTPPMATHLMSDPGQYLTPIGRFLRKTSLDELPQLWCILNGEMSFVGPRPALFNQDDLIALRTESGVDALVPGLTGWAQVNGRDELPIPEKVRLDAEYLEKRSLAFDLAILWRTIVNVVSRKDISH